MSSISSADESADHLVVLIHGLWGNPSHLDYLVKALRERHGKDDLHILVPKGNSSNFTYDGIETGGERIMHEVEAEIDKLEKNGSTIRKISIIGYSLGGLLARYTIGLLYAEGLFKTVQPVNFTTFATPHIGVRTPSKSKASHIWNVLGARTLSVSGRQLFTVDNFRDTGRPLLSIMADPNSVFIKGLKMFKNKSIYANIINDRSVPYYTAAFDSTDPYADLKKVNLNAIEGTEGVMLDLDDPVQRIATELPLGQRFADGALQAVSAIPFAIFVTCILPFGLTYYLGNSLVQSFKSVKRIQLHESGDAGIKVARYRKTPFLVDEMRHVADKVYRQAANTSGEDYLPTPPPELADEEVISDKPTKESKTRKSGKDEWPILALTDEQFEMIDSLNEVGLTKYKVHISSVRHTHAAIIVRIQWRPGMGQGKIVVKHWVDGFDV